MSLIRRGEKWSKAASRKLPGAPSGREVRHRRWGRTQRYSFKRDVGERSPTRLVATATLQLILDSERPRDIASRTDPPTRGSFLRRRDPLKGRKARLELMLAKARPCTRFNEHMEGDGETVFRHACKLGLGLWFPSTVSEMSDAHRQPLAPPRCRGFFFVGARHATIGLLRRVLTNAQIAAPTFLGQRRRRDD